MTYTQDIIDGALKYLAKSLREEAEALRVSSNMTNKPTHMKRLVPQGTYDIASIHLLHFDGGVPYQDLVGGNFELTCLIIDSLEDGAKRLDTGVGSKVDLSDIVRVRHASLRGDALQT